MTRSLAIVGGRFQPLEPLAEAASGVVWRGVDLRTRRQVAIRRLWGPPPETLARLETYALLEHPGLVPVIAWGRGEAGDLWLAEELVRGETLSRLAGRRHGLASRRAARILAEVAGALEAVHAAGLVHGALHARRIMLPERASEGSVRLLPLCLRAEPIAGTVVAPEILRGEPASPASDLYSLGACLFQALTGRPPLVHLGRSGPTLLARARAIEPSIPEALDELVARLMASEAEDRPSGAMFVRTILAGPIRGQSAASSTRKGLPVPPPQSAPPRRRESGTRPTSPGRPAVRIP